jgi:hypothetical protein
MASVNVEFQAFRDPRFRVLAKLSGLSHFDAIGRMAAVWAYSVEKNSNILDRTHFDALAEIEGYTDWAVEADLAERLEGNVVRVKGTEGRIEWLAKARQRQKLASQAAKEKRDRDRSSKPHPKSDAISAPSLVSSSASASASKKRRLVDPSDTTILWEFYAKEVRENGIEPIHEGGKTNTLLKRLVNQHGLEKAKALVRVYTADKSTFISDKAWMLPLLVSQQQQYLAKLNSVRAKAVLTFGDDS